MAVKWAESKETGTVLRTPHTERQTSQTLKVPSLSEPSRMTLNTVQVISSEVSEMSIDDRIETQNRPRENSMGKMMIRKIKIR